MNKISYSLLFSSLFFINVLAQTPQQLNTLEDGYSPLHRLILETEDILPLYIQAAKNAVPAWTEAHGDSFCGEAGNGPDPVSVTWKAGVYTKDEIIDAVITNVKETATAYANEVKSLIKAGAHVDLPDSYGRTALWWAAERNQPEIMSVLIDAGANVDSKCSLGCTPLDVAACDGNKEAVECLLTHRANPNSINDNGDTPLHSAARGELWIYPSDLPEYQKITPEKLQDYKDVITLLIRHGAIPTIQNQAGRTPAQEARAQQQEFYPELAKSGYPLAKHIETLTSK